MFLLVCKLKQSLNQINLDLVGTSCDGSTCKQVLRYQFEVWEMKCRFLSQLCVGFADFFDALGKF